MLSALRLCLEVMETTSIGRMIPAMQAAKKAIQQATNP
jgi:hypothetical protein